MNRYRKIITKKTTDWASQDQVDYISSCPQKLFSEIQLYELKDEIKIYPSIQQKDNIQVLNTINLFNSYAENEGYPLNFFNQIKSSLQSIKDRDIVFRWNGESYLYHTYKILGFIKDAISAHFLSNNEQFIKGTIADLDRLNRSYLSEYKKYKEQCLDPFSPYKGNALINAVIYKNLHYREKFTKQYLSYFAIMGVDNFKSLQKIDLESKMLKNTLAVFMSGKVSEEDCAKSLLSVLYFYLVFRVKLKKAHALAVTRDIVFQIFDISYEYKGSELLKNIHVKEVVGTHVIYGFSTKTQFIKDSHKHSLQNILTNQTDLPAIDIRKFPSHIVKTSIDNPLRLYTLLTPSELLQEMQ